MRAIEIDLPCALEEAALLNAEEREFLGPGDVLIEPATLRRLALTWAWLRGFAPDSPEGQQAQESVMDDMPLAVALALPASEFLRWFRMEKWEHWTEAEEGGEAWAWDVLMRARGAAVALGPMASQVSLRPS